MKLHPITQLIVVAIGLRLSADAILLADVLRTMIQDIRETGSIFGTLEGAQYLAFSSISAHFAEVAQALEYAALAIFVELLSRWWLVLKNSRMKRSLKSIGSPA